MRPILLFLFFSSIAFAQIAAVGGTTAPAASSQPITYTYSPTAGNIIVGAHFVNSVGTYVYGFDTNYRSLLPAGNVTNGSNTASAFAAVAASGATSYVGRWSGGTDADGLLEEFSGVLSTSYLLTSSAPCSSGTSATACGSGTSVSFSMTMDEAGDQVVCILETGSATFSATSTAILQSITSGAAPFGALFLASTVGTTATCSGTLSASQAWDGIGIELRVVPTAPPFSFAQITPSGYNISGTFGCPRGTAVNNALVCTFPVAEIGSGQALALGFTDDFDTSGGSENSIVSVYDCTVSTGCNSGNSINNWTIPSSCSNFAQTSSYSESVGGAYVVSSISGATYITVTRASNLVNEPWGLTLFALIPRTTGSLDSVNSQADNFNSTSHTMTSTTPTGTMDAILQFYAGGTQQFPSSPYVLAIQYSHEAYAFALNQSSGNAPTWSNVDSTPAAGCAMAFKIPLLGSTVVGHKLRGRKIN